MSPLDDELRAALHGRAQVLAPSPDPLAGIERRAKRMQRNRVGAAVVGSALAVALVAAVVPAVQSGMTPRSDAPRVATSTAPSEQHTTDTAEYALNTLSPWPYRGASLDQLGMGTLDTIEREYAVRRSARSVELTPLFGQVYESSQQFELVFLADVEAGDGVHQYFWGVSRTPADAGPEFIGDQALDEGAVALAVALPGDETARLLVVTAPDAGDVQYGPDDASEFTTMEPLAAGVAVGPLDGDRATDVYRVLDPAGSEVQRAPAPDAPDAQPTAATALDPAQPWELRGDRALVTDGQLDALAAVWALRHNEPADAVTLTPLYVAGHEPSASVDVVYLIRSGDGSWWWGVSARGNDRWFWYADNELAPGTTALAAALPGDEGAERLLVVAAPSTGGALYAADGRSYKPTADVDGGVFVTPIDPGDVDDRFKVLDGDGDLDNPVFEGPAPDFQNTG